MYLPLVPCPSCKRHVRSSEASCPFCAASLPSNLASRAVPGASRRIHRGAMYTFATIASVASTVALASCSSTSTTTPTPGPSDGTTADSPGDTVPDDGNPGVMYGPAPFDSGPDDDGAPGAKYGSPPIDSGGG